MEETLKSARDVVKGESRGGGSILGAQRDDILGVRCCVAEAAHFQLLL